MNILVVDDSPTQRALWMYSLTSTGLPVTLVEKPSEAIARTSASTLRLLTTRNGEQAIEYMRAIEVSLLITDLDMPGISGWEVARQAQAMSSAMPVVIVSSNVETGQAPDPGLDPKRTFIFSKSNREQAATMIQQILSDKLAQ